MRETSGPRAPCRQHLDESDLPGGAGEVERPAAVGVRDVRIRTALHQHGYHAGVSGGSRVVERRLAVPAPGVDVGPVVEEQANLVRPLAFVAARDVHQGRHAPPGPPVRGRAPAQQVPHQVEVGIDEDADVHGPRIRAVGEQQVHEIPTLRARREREKLRAVRDDGGPAPDEGFGQCRVAAGHGEREQGDVVDIVVRVFGRQQLGVCGELPLDALAVPEERRPEDVERRAVFPQILRDVPPPVVAGGAVRRDLDERLTVVAARGVDVGAGLDEQVYRRHLAGSGGFPEQRPVVAPTLAQEVGVLSQQRLERGKVPLLGDVQVFLW